MQEVSKEVVEKARERLIQELKEFATGGIHSGWKESALALISDLEAGRPANIGGRIFSEFLDGAIESAGVKLYSSEYQSIYKQLTAGSQEQSRKGQVRTLELVVLETLPTGETVEQILECNGIVHRRCVDKVSRDAEGNIIFVEEVSRQELGPCNGKHS